MQWGMATTHLDRHLLLLAIMVWGSLAAVIAFIGGRMIYRPGRSSRRRGGAAELR